MKETVYKVRKKADNIFLYERLGILWKGNLTKVPNCVFMVYNHNGQIRKGWSSCMPLPILVKPRDLF